MNPIFKIITNLIIAINRLLDNIDKGMADTIKQGFYFLMFVLLLVGIIIGIKKGKESARIKSPPLAKNVNQLFKPQMNVEKKGGNFNGMIDSPLIREMKSRSDEKIPFRTREGMKPEIQMNPIEPEKDVKVNTDPMPHDVDTPVEGTYKPIVRAGGEKNPIERKKPVYDDDIAAGNSRGKGNPDQLVDDKPASEASIDKKGKDARPVKDNRSEMKQKVPGKEPSRPKPLKKSGVFD